MANEMYGTDVTQLRTKSDRDKCLATGIGTGKGVPRGGEATAFFYLTHGIQGMGSIYSSQSYSCGRERYERSRAHCLSPLPKGTGNWFYYPVPVIPLLPREGEIPEQRCLLSTLPSSEPLFHLLK